MRDIERQADWFRATYERHYSAVVRYGLRRLDGLAEAEELAQEVFTVAWRRRSEVPTKTLPWLYGVARRLLANHWRTQRSGPRFEQLTDVEPIEATASDRHDGLAGLIDVRAALTRLPDDDQEILRLVGWEQLSLSEAGQVLGCSAAAAKVRLHRARRRLREALEQPPAQVPSPISSRER